MARLTSSSPVRSRSSSTTRPRLSNLPGQPRGEDSTRRAARVIRRREEEPRKLLVSTEPLLVCLWMKSTEERIKLLISERSSEKMPEKRFKRERRSKLKREEITEKPTATRIRLKLTSARSKARISRVRVADNTLNPHDDLADFTPFQPPGVLGCWGFGVWGFWGFGMQRSSFVREVWIEDTPKRSCITVATELLRGSQDTWALYSFFTIFRLITRHFTIFKNFRPNLDEKCSKRKHACQQHGQRIG